MYKVKRFSSYKPNKGLGIERYYSEYLLEQREYGLGRDLRSVISNIRKSGFKDGVKEFKESKLKELNKEISSLSLKKQVSELRDINGIDKVTNNKIKTSLVNQSEKNKAKILDIDTGRGSSHVKSSRAKGKSFESEFENDGDLDKFNKAVDSSRHVIIYPEKSEGVEKLAHEMGHMKNSDSLNPVKRGVSKLSDLVGEIDSDVYKNESGLLSAGKNFLKGKIKLAEESNATKRGMKFLKDAGASSEELEKARKSLDNAYATYDYGSKLSVKYPLVNKLKKDLNKANIKNKKGGA